MMPRHHFSHPSVQVNQAQSLVLHTSRCQAKESVILPALSKKLQSFPSAFLSVLLEELISQLSSIFNFRSSSSILPVELNNAT